MYEALKQHEHMLHEIDSAMKKDAELPQECAQGTGPDPWAHRSSEMRCNDCMWYVPKVVGITQTILGRCRRHAPTMGGYPAVYQTDWCGDHKLDEKKA
jgi:hypothetical protein